MPTEFCERYGPVALVTGASSGIGEAFAEELAMRGFDLVLSARRVGRLEALAERLGEAHGVKVEIVPADLTDPEAPEKLVEACAGRDIGLVVSNAGFNMKGPFEKGSATRMAKMLTVNCHAPMQIAHGFIPSLKARAEAGRGAALIVTASVEGLIGCPYSTAYSSTKALVVSLCEGLWAELRPCGVDVLALCPGATESEATIGSGLPESVLAHLQPAREVAALTLDNVANGPSFIPSDRYRGMFERLLAQPRREALIGMEETMRNLA
jgi:hypothetical protein